MKSVYEIIRRQNGRAFAQTLKNEGLLHIPDLPQRLRFAGRGNPDPKLVAFLRQECWCDDKGQYDEDAYIHHLFDNEEGKLLLSFWKEKNYMLFVQHLFEKAGYDMIIADTLEKQNSIRKYFRPDEELCTFRDKKRFENYYIIHAVKKNACAIQPAENPEREDEYGASVISIQIFKKGGYISIKCRYNHTVECPDNTFSSNPDNIILGLSCGLKRLFGVDFNSASLPENYLMSDGYFFKYHTESDNVYYGENYYIKDNQCTVIDTDSQIIVEDCVIDLKEKKVFSPSDSGLAKLLQDEIQSKTIQVSKDKNGRKILTANGKIILLLNAGELEELYLPETTIMPSDALIGCNQLKKVSAEKLKKISGSNFRSCFALEELKFPVLESVGNMCFINCKAVKDIICQDIGQYSFMSCDEVSVYTEKSKGDCFINCQNVQVYGLESIKNHSFVGCRAVMTEAKYADDGCFIGCEIVQASGLIGCGDGCFHQCTEVDTSVRFSGKHCFVKCKILSLPNLSKTGKECFHKCHFVDTGLRKAGFLSFYECRYVNAPALEMTEDGCFHDCRFVIVPKLKNIGKCCFMDCHWVDNPLSLNQKKSSSLAQRSNSLQVYTHLLKGNKR